jgi:xanthine/CO dehydrogenase XdhC/CoxF family maturation factor
VELTPAVELPVPGGASASDPWRKFVSYTLDKVREWESGGSQSALLVRGTSLASPQMRPCTASTAAVMLDLDPEDGVFGASPNAAPPPGLAEGLARLRDAGIVALWITRRPSADVAAVARALKTSGLDPEGRDPMLLVRSADDRKQTLREQANEDVCVIAIAGDRKSDFDELFDYLRDPNGAPGLDQLLGAGWFIAPPPLG